MKPSSTETRHQGLVKNMRENIRKMYTYVAKDLITAAIYKCVLSSLRLSQRDIKIPLSS